MSTSAAASSMFWIKWAAMQKEDSTLRHIGVVGKLQAGVYDLRQK